MNVNQGEKCYVLVESCDSNIFASVFMNLRDACIEMEEAIKSVEEEYQQNGFTTAKHQSERDAFFWVEEKNLNFEWNILNAEIR